MWTTQGQSWCIFVLRVELFTRLLYKSTGMSGGNLFEVDVGRQEVCFFLLLLFSTRIIKAPPEKCATTAGLRGRFYVIRMKVSTVHSFVTDLSWWDKQLMPAVGGCRQLCWIHADATTCNQQLCLFRPLSYIYVGGCCGWSGSSESWSHVIVWLLHFVVSLCLTISQVDWQHYWQLTEIKSDPLLLPTLPCQEKKWFDLTIFCHFLIF